MSPTSAPVVMPLPEWRPVSCPDCGVTATPGSNHFAHHAGTCPAARSITAAHAADRAYFAAAPDAGYLLRPVVWGEVVHWRLAGVVGAQIVDLATLLTMLMRVENVGVGGVVELRRTPHPPVRPL